MFYELYQHLLIYEPLLAVISNCLTGITHRYNRNLPNFPTGMALLHTAAPAAGATWSLSSVLWVCLAGTATILGLVVTSEDLRGGSLASVPRNAMFYHRLALNTFLLKLPRVNASLACSRREEVSLGHPHLTSGTYTPTSRSTPQVQASEAPPPRRCV